MLCLFSFEAFAPTRQEGKVRINNLEEILSDPIMRKSLISGVIEPLAMAAEQSPYRHRLLAWDLINEPEWALTGRGAPEDPSFYLLKTVRPVTYDFMSGFLQELTAGLRRHSSALITVGQTAPRWKHAWTHLKPDFYQWHLYDWMDERSVYLDPPDDKLCKPVVFGEIPMAPLVNDQNPGAPGTDERYKEMVLKMKTNGWAGAWAWSYRGRVPRNAPLSRLKSAFE